MATTIAISSGQFTINGVQTFLLGETYFDAINARQSDLAGFAQKGVNFLRLMLDWPDPTHAAGSLFNSDGTLKTTEKATLLSFIQAASSNGIVIELVILNGSSDAYLTTSGARTAAVQNACAYFGGEPNVMFDICNEIASQCAFATTFASHGALLTTAQANTSAICYVSGDSGTTEGDGPILNWTTGAVDTSYITSWMANANDVLAVHPKGDVGWWYKKYTRTTNLRAWLDANGHSGVPILYNEDNRWGTGYGDAGAGDVPADCYISTALDAKRAGAAGWVHHSNASYDMSSAITWTSRYTESPTQEADVFNRMGESIAAGGILTAYTTVDSFTRANEGPPPSNQWSVLAGTGLKVVSNVAVGNATGQQASAWGAHYHPNQRAQFTIAGSNPANDGYSQVVLLRLRNPTDVDGIHYRVTFNNHLSLGQYEIYRCNGGGSYTQLGATGALASALVVGSICGASIVGSTITVYFNNSAITTRTDSTYSTGGYTAIRTGDGTNGYNFDVYQAGAVFSSDANLLGGKFHMKLKGKF